MRKSSSAFWVVAACFLCDPAGNGHAGKAYGSDAMHEIYRPVLIDWRWGYARSNGDIVIRPRFQSAEDFFEDRAWASESMKHGYLRPDGKWAFTIPDRAFPARRFSEGRAWFVQDGKYGCIDQEGRIVLPPQFDSCEAFSEGMAVVMKRHETGAEGEAAERWGFVDREGNIAIPLIYAYAGRFGDGLACVRRPESRHYHYMDRAQRVAFSLERFADPPRRFVGGAGDFAEGRVSVSLDGGPNDPQALLLDTRGRVVGSFDWAGNLSEGRVMVQIGTRIGYADRDARVVIPARFEEGGDFREGLCRVRLGEEWQFIDRMGQVIAKSRDAESPWNDAEDFHGDLARVHIGGTFEESAHGPSLWTGGAWYYCNRQGDIVVRCRADGEGRVYYGKELPPP